ncbi:MAG TPA: hypothetical protein VKU19_04755 [Bryobacteraceae bacterium]|nr:hypothetical protein [Bryobacteraceae bacterium]
MMQQTRVIVSLLMAQPLGALLFGAPQNLRPEVEQQIKAQYPISRVGVNGTVLQGGQVLTVQIDGMKAYLASLNQNYYPNDFKKDGKKVTQSLGGSMLRMPVGGPTAIPKIEAGAKVYLMGIEFKKEEIVFLVQSYGGVPMRAGLTFHFPKGFLETANYDAVKETISNVFAVDNAPPPPQSIAPPPDTQQQQLQDAQQQQQVQPPQQQQQQQPPVTDQPDPNKPQPTVSMGDTIDQVIANMGQPDRKAKIGNKDIFSYKDLKITFIDGKVTDVQ